MANKSGRIKTHLINYFGKKEWKLITQSAFTRDIDFASPCRNTGRTSSIHIKKTRVDSERSHCKRARNG